MNTQTTLSAIQQRQINENKIMQHLFTLMEAGGWKLLYLDDGEEEAVHPKTINEAIEYANNLDEVTFVFRSDKQRMSCFVYLIFGNGNDGFDVIADHAAPKSDNFDDFAPDFIPPTPSDKRFSAIMYRVGRYVEHLEQMPGTVA